MYGLPDDKAQEAEVGKVGRDGARDVSMIGHGCHPERTVSGRMARLIRMGIVEYGQAWTYQRQLVEERQAGRSVDTLLLLEHRPVFTLGRTACERHWGGSRAALEQQGFDVYAVERGGSVTYHGPGQLVGYPILTMRSYCSGPKAYVEKLEEVLIRVLAEWGVAAGRVEPWRGVWVEDSGQALQKIASVGVRITRGVTWHGFALNVNVDLGPFALITPCGIEGCRVTSLASVLGHPVDQGRVQDQIARHFSDVFGLEWIDDAGDRPREGN